MKSDKIKVKEDDMKKYSLNSCHDDNEGGDRGHDQGES